MIRVLAFALLAAAIAQPAVGAPGGAVVRVEHRDPSALPSRGPTNALVTVELFFTPGTGSRMQNYRYVEQLQAKHPTRIRLVYRIVKVGQARTPYAALEAHAQGKFFEFMDALHNNPRGMNLRDQDLIELGKKVGLDTDRLASVMSKGPASYTKVLEANERRRTQKFRGPPPPPNVLFNGRVPSTQLSALGVADLEKEYQAAIQYAEELLDRGADRASLAEAFDQLGTEPPEINVQFSRTDEEIGDEPWKPVLAKPPLDLRGLPAYGPVEVVTTIVVLCSPTSSNCLAPMRSARIIQELYPEHVRVVWGPYFDVTRPHEEVAELSLLSDAALCAEKVGITLEDNDDSFHGAASPGWRWVETVFAETNRRRMPSEKLIDKIADKLRVDRRAFATCRAQLAGTSIGLIEAARRSGVRMTPSTVVGGRIYGPIEERQALQHLVEAELAPGVLGEAAPAWSRPETAR